MLITEEYQKQLYDYHHENVLWGNGPRKRIADVFSFIKEFNIRECLDYGCGKAKLSSILPLKVINYDPCVPGFSDDPRVCEYTFCIDVMEHIEEECVDDVIKHIKKKTREKAFVCISTSPAKDILPDGRNAHITLKDFIWWYNKYKQYFNIEQAIFNGDESFWLIVS